MSKATGVYGPSISFNEGVDMIVTNFLSENKDPIMFWGGPGLGKSAMPRVAQAYLEKKLNKKVEVVDLRLLLLEPSDLRGLPYVNKDDECKWAIAPFLPTDPESYGILFLDEMTAASQSLMKASLQLTLDRRIGEYELPKNWLVIAAGNRLKDRGGVVSMPKPLSNRFQHAELEVSLEDWVSWAYDNNVEQSVIGFVRFKPDALYRFDVNNEAWASPRSWEKVNNRMQTGVHSHRDLVQDEKDRILKKSVCGLIGEGTGTEYFAFRRLYKDLPTPEDVLNGNFKINLNESDKLFAVSTSLVSYINQKRVADPRWKPDDRMINNVLNFVEHIASRKDFQVAITRDLAINAKLNTALLSHERSPEVKTRWKKIFGEISPYM